MPNKGTTKDKNKTEHPHPAPPPSEGEGEGGGWFICVLNYNHQTSFADWQIGIYLELGIWSL